MNVNSLPQASVIKDWLFTTSKKFELAGIETSLLDAELILSFYYNKNRTYLHAHSNKKIDSADLISLEILVNQRINRLPIAYITGFKEFYGRKFLVSRDTLIPRPESEIIIDTLKNLLKKHTAKPNLKLVDIGTGSGCLGITLKKELPNLDVTLVDNSKKALKIAENNSKQLDVSIKIIYSNLMQKINDKFDIIVANLPYVDRNWKRSPETDYEPAKALFSRDNGLHLINKLVKQANNKLEPGGFVVLEADPTQHKTIVEYSKNYDFSKLIIVDYVIVLKFNSNVI